MNAYRILMREHLENLKGIWDENIRLTFVGIYHGSHLLFIQQDNVAVVFDAVWSGRGYRACGYARLLLNPADGCTILLLHVAKFLPNYTASCGKKMSSIFTAVIISIV